MARPNGGGTGILFVDKPLGLTSHDVVARVRRIAGTRKVGHAGTLDPLATGLLTLGINSSTRLLTYLVGLDKEYFATIRLGASTTTDDAEGEAVVAATAAEIAAITSEAIQRGIAALTGEIEQTPSTFSAIKVDGKRAYDLARAGETVELASRAVTVSAFDLLETHTSEFVDLDVRVECSSGTYIRALARDLGAGLGVGGHLTALRRTRVGPFGIADATTLADLSELGIETALRDPALIATSLFDSIELDGAQVIELTQGKRVATDRESSVTPIVAIGPTGRIVALVEVSRGTLRVLTGFPTDEVLA